MSEQMPSRTVLLFGASGFVGRNLVERLTDENWRIIAVNASGNPVDRCAETVAFADLDLLGALPTDLIAIQVAAFRYDPERLTLAQSDILLNNVDIAGRFYHFCAARGITEVRLASSVAVYPSDDAVMDDEAPLSLDGAPFEGERFYAWSKRYAEIIADLYRHKFGINSVIFRFSNPYGPYDSTSLKKAHVAPAFVMKALSASDVFEIKGSAGVERDFVYVGDVVDIIVKTLAWRGRNDVINVATGQGTTLQTLAETALAAAGSEKRIEAGAPGAFGPLRRRTTANRARTILGRPFTSLQDGLEATVTWYREVWRG